MHSENGDSTKYEIVILGLFCFAAALSTFAELWSWGIMLKVLSILNVWMAARVVSSGSPAVTHLRLPVVIAAISVGTTGIVSMQHWVAPQTLWWVIKLMSLTMLLVGMALNLRSRASRQSLGLSTVITFLAYIASSAMAVDDLATALGIKGPLDT